MFERLKRLFNQGLLDKTAIANAVIKGWISQDQADEIINGQTNDNNNNNTP